MFFSYVSSSSRPARSPSAGLTFVETIVALALFAVLSLAVMEGVHSLYQFNAYTFAQTYQVQNARFGMESLIRDIREMTFADDGTFPLAVMEQHEIGFYSDIDRDDSVEFVRYQLIGTSTLQKSVHDASGDPPSYDLTTADSTEILSRYVQNINQATSTFRYFDNAGTELIDPADITEVRYIEAQLIVNVDPIRDPGQFMLRSSAALRNVQEQL